jgi:hypothetical protein
VGKSRLAYAAAQFAGVFSVSAWTTWDRMMARLTLGPRGNYVKKVANPAGLAIRIGRWNAVSAGGGHLMIAWRLLIGLVAVAACVAPLVAQETPERNISRVRQAADTFDKGRKWAVVIGINKYLDPAIHEGEGASAAVRH